ncbi:MAG: hypothetical protein IMX01_07330 [Limnochordaceae bacterium]|nr:hypothetical protein [Limnochordaceae bacterium]
MARPKRLLVVSNGHGEDAVGRMVVQRTRELAGGLLQIEAFPLVGMGEAYRQAGIPVVGPLAELPSGGFIYLSLGNLIQDLRSGWLGLVLRQLRFAWRHRQEFDGIIGVGDRVSLDLNYYVFRKPMIWVEIAYSARPLPPGTHLGNPSMWRAMRQYCTDVFVRDPETAASFQTVGIRAEYVGNPMMDAVMVSAKEIGEAKELLRAAGWDGRKALVALLPGSHQDALINLVDQLKVLQTLHARTGGEVQGVVAWASGLNIQAQALGDPLSRAGWRLRPFTDSALCENDVHGDGGDHAGRDARGDPGKDAGAGPAYVATCGDGRCENQMKVAIIPGRFASILHLCSLVIGQAGTAVEQAVGLGKPVITFESRGVQVTRRFLAGQKELLGDAVAVVDPDPEAVAAEGVAILGDPERRRAITRASSQLMGSFGGTDAIAQRIVKRFLELPTAHATQ